MSAFIPLQDTWSRDINRVYFNTWPLLTAKDINKMPKAEATIEVHLAHIRKHARTTITNNNIGYKHTNTDPIQEQHNFKTDIIMDTVNKTHNIYTDHMGKFPMKSIRVNQYVLIMYVYYDNAILTEPLKSRSGSHILEAYTKQFKHLKNMGYIPGFHWIVNESSASLKKYNRQEYIGYQLVPSHIHRVNAAESSIRAWKDHFIAVLAITDTWFPMHLWCRLIPQATMTLNILRP